MVDASGSERVAQDHVNGGVGRATGSFGPNAWLVDDMYERFAADPGSVSESWQEFFADYRPAPLPAPALPLARPPDALPAPASGETENGRSAGSNGTPHPVVPTRVTETDAAEAVPLRGAAS